VLAMGASCRRWRHVRPRREGVTDTYSAGSSMAISL
jgi:hypothetical protein